MKVTVSKYLNVRVGQPRLDAPNYQYLAPGSILEVDGKLYDGQPYDNNDKWYRDYADNYYWSGGVENYQNLTSNKSLVLNEFIDYRKLVKLKDWNFRTIDEGGFSNIKIAILDSGIYWKHPEFKNKNTFLPNSNDLGVDNNNNYIDKRGHGTKVAGIIGARGRGLIGLKGICPDSRILSIKVLNENGRSNSLLTQNGIIELSKHPNIKIANLSYSLAKRAYKEVEDLFNTISETKILVAAAGNDEILQYGVRYPSKNENIISVASISVDKLLTSNLKFPKELDYVIPSLELVSTNNNPEDLFGECTGSSFAAPIITGLIAELCFTNEHIKNKVDATNLLDKHCFTLIEFQKQFKNHNNLKNGLPIIKTS